MTDDQADHRLRELLAAAVAGLDPIDREERIAWCQELGEHGVRMHLADDDDVLEFRWGGRRLAMIHRDALLEDGPIEAEFIADVPDTPAELDDDQGGGWPP